MDFTINNQQKQNLFFWYNIIVKEKQMKNKTLQRVYKMLKPQTKAIIIISILSIIINIGEVIKPYLIKIVMDDYLSSGLWQKGIISIGIIGSIYIAIVLIGNILDFIVTTSTSMMGENVKKETVDYLPLGSVVILKGGVQKVVVIARGLLSVATGKEGYFDYGGCLYPQGLVGDQILYFNHRDIVKVVFSGFHDDDDKMMVDNINQWYMESPYERTDVEKLVRERGAQDGGKLG